MTIDDGRQVASQDSTPDTAPTWRTDRGATVALVGFGAAMVVALWLPMLGFGLMTDELLSTWVTSDGLATTVERAQAYQGNSPLYFVLLWLWRSAVGSSEWVLRLPSLVCALAAAWHLWRLGAELDDGRKLTGLVAAFVLLADTEVMLAATTARPYGLLVLLVVVSARALLHFADDGSLRAGSTWVLTAAASLAMTPFAGLVLFAHAVVLVDRMRGRTIELARPVASRPVEPAVWRRRLGLVASVGVLISLPLVPQVLALSRRTDELVIAAVPDVSDLAEAILPIALLTSVLLGVVAGGWRTRRRNDGPMLRFVAAWALVPIVGTWAISNASGTSIWVERYRLGAVPAIALLVGLGVSRIARPHGRAIACGALIVVSLWSASGYAGLQRQGWREAVDWAVEETAGEPVTIAIDSDLIELGTLALLDQPAWQEYLSSPVQHYRLPGEIVLLPKGPGDEVRAHQRRVIDRLAESDDTIVVISTVLFRGPPDQLGAIRTVLEADGWDETPGPIIGPHQAVVFRR